MSAPIVSSGLDVLTAENFRSLAGKRVAFLGNQASVNRTFDHAVDLLLAAKNVQLVRLFAPEHGFRGTAQDMETVGHTTDKISGLPVLSLYGNSEASLAPRAEDLHDIDVIVFDLPDVGTRYYTFAQTLAAVMRVAATSRVKVVVLDRPNPLGGVIIEGSNLSAAYRSFCGYAPIPVRHGLTMGELAKLMNSGFSFAGEHIDAIGCDLEIIHMIGWKRSMFFDQTGLPWIVPSPNMPTLDTALVYPGSCLFEASNISEARGTTRPFEFLGAPYIESVAWIERTEKLLGRLTGCALRPCTFIPQFQKHKGIACHGLQIHVTDRTAFQPYRLSLALLAAAVQLFPHDFSWRAQAYEFRQDIPAIDLLFGSSLFREVVEKKQALDRVWAEVKSTEDAFRALAPSLWLYPLTQD